MNKKSKNIYMYIGPSLLNCCCKLSHHSDRAHPPLSEEHNYYTTFIWIIMSCTYPYNVQLLGLHC